MTDKSTPEKEPKPEIKALGNELGVEQNLPFSTPFMELSTGGKKSLNEQLRNESEDLGPTVEQLVAMRRMDGQARGLYRLVTLPIRSALTKATFVPAEGGEAEAEFITQVFELPPQSGGMSVTFHRFMAQLLAALFDGFAAFEQVYWQPTTGPLAGKYTLQKLAHRPAETITFVTDDNGRFAGLRQRASLNGKYRDVYIPREQAFYFAAQEEERKFYGVSYFQSAFYHYDKKMRLYYTAHLAAQRAAVGTRVGTVPLNASQEAKKEFNAALGNLAFAQFLTMPETFQVEILKEGGNFDFLDFINHHNSAMSKSVLATFFDEDTGKGSNDQVLVQNGQPGDEIFMLMIRAIMDEIANSINHYIIPRLIDWNFPGSKYPKFTWGTLTDDQRAAIFTIFQTLSTGQPNVTPEFLRSIEVSVSTELGLDIDYEAIQQREDEQEAQQQDHQSQVDQVTIEGMKAGVEATKAGVAAAKSSIPPAKQVKKSVRPGQTALSATEDPENKILELAHEFLDEADDLIQ